LQAQLQMEVSWFVVGQCLYKKGLSAHLGLLHTSMLEVAWTLWWEIGDLQAHPMKST
jgi:hypothetical protein